MQVSLVSPAAVTLQAPALAGLSPITLAQPWSVSRLAELFHVLRSSLRGFASRADARHRLSVLDVMPVDQLEALYEGAIGDLQRLLLQGPLVRQDLARDERRWADQLRQLIAAPTEQAQQLGILLALMRHRPTGWAWASRSGVAARCCRITSVIALRVSRCGSQPELRAAQADDDPVVSRWNGAAVRSPRRSGDGLVRDAGYQEMKSCSGLCAGAGRADVLDALGGLRAVVAQLWLMWNRCSCRPCSIPPWGRSPSC